MPYQSNLCADVQFKLPSFNYYLFTFDFRHLYDTFSQSLLTTLLTVAMDRTSYCGYGCACYLTITSFEHDAVIIILINSTCLIAPNAAIINVNYTVIRTGLAKKANYLGSKNKRKNGQAFFRYRKE